MVEELLKEYSIEIDDIRWYLSVLLAKQFIEYKENINGLAEFVWSKRLETELYEMEERFLKQLKSDFEKERIDEGRIREIMAEIKTEKAKRMRSRLKSE